VDLPESPTGFLLFCVIIEIGSNGVAEGHHFGKKLKIAALAGDFFF
jgi:hypothetical protein